MPQEEQRLSGSLQENILTVLCFDDKHAKIIRSAITPHLFESAVFREVSGHAIDFLDQYDEAIKEHLPDHLEDILKGDDERKAKTYRKLIDNLFASRESVNAEYVISQLHKFVRQQGLKSSVVKAVEALQDGRIDEAEGELHKALKARVLSFEPGLDLSDAGVVNAIFEQPEEEGFSMGIEGIDDVGIQARRKELLAFLAPRKRGKSWFITHLAKRARMQRWKAAVITLEMSERRYGARMLQSFFSISRREAEIDTARFVKGRDGQLEDIIHERLKRDTMRDEDVRSKLVARAKKQFSRGVPLKIKAFPTGMLDMPMLEAQLDNWERIDGFVPDVLFIDYPRLMKLDTKNLRLELGATIAALRGLGISRNMAIVVVHQGNRESERATWVTADMAEEDISLLAHVDAIITYSQTPQEKRMGLARLSVDAARNEESKVQVLITQAYAIGQFCLDSVVLKSENYWKLLQSKATPGEKQEGDGEERRKTKRRDEDDDDDRPRGERRRKGE